MAGGGGGSPLALPPAAGATLRAAAATASARGLPNCFQTAKTGGGRVGTRGEKMSLGGGDCVFRRWEPRGKAVVDLSRVAIEVSRLRLPLRPGDPLPLELSWGRETRILTTFTFTFLGGCSPRLDLSDRSYFLCFYFWRGAPCNCPEHMLLPPLPGSSHQRKRVPLFCIYLFLPLSLLKVREWR